MGSKCPYCKRSGVRRELDETLWCVSGHWWYNDYAWLDQLEKIMQWSF